MGVGGSGILFGCVRVESDAVHDNKSMVADSIRNFFLTSVANPLASSCTCSGE